ncbi:MAG: monovalent cation:proton antiporter-2 (CPA2) family protein [Thiogranum sp.]|nr:monovalent cation:proton antiporter-2 (CPA2) family protein [Thiogranum sp.]
MLSSYLVDLVILLAAAVVAVPLCQAARLGAVPGFLIAGMLVGPSALGIIENIDAIKYFAEIGVVLLLFVIGMELKPARLWVMRRFVFGLGSLQVLLTGLVISAGAVLLFGLPLSAALLVGPALALSSTAFVLQLLVEQKALHSQYGRGSFAVLLLQDIAVVPLLALIPLLAAPVVSAGEGMALKLMISLAVLTLVVVAGRYLLHPVLHRVALSGNPELFTASAVLIVLGTALVTEHVGFSMAMGAFLAGLLMSDSAYRHQVMAEIKPFRGLLLGLFFMSMGMSLDLGRLFEAPLLALGLVGVLVATKVLVLWPLAHAFGLRGRTGLAVALVLGQSGEFALVLFALAYQAALIDQPLFQELLVVVLLSMLVTPLLAHLARKLALMPQLDDGPHESPLPAPVVIAGYGRVGHRIGEILTIARQPFVALDLDAALVKKARSQGRPVYFGDVRQPEVLLAAGAADARVVIVTLNDTEATEQVVMSLRANYPGMNIFVRGHSLEQCQVLRRMGASAAVSENVEASLELARIALAEVGVNEEERTGILDGFRRTYRAAINEVDNDTSHNLRN